MGYLVLVRHGTSTFNEQGLWTGWLNPDLAPKGIEEAKAVGATLQNIPFTRAYTSSLNRAKQTLEEIKRILHKEDLPTIESPLLNERNYGDYGGKNKWQVKELVGEEEFQKIRRGWDYPIPNGESLKQVYVREIPFFQKEILPKVENGENILITSSGNALRAIVKLLENIPDDQIAEVEIGLAEAHVYQIDESGKIISKEIRAKNTNAGKI